MALDQGVLGQETVGAGGISYGLRTVPVAIEVARRIAELAPDAWTINFTNPAGLVTERRWPRAWSDRVIGICDFAGRAHPPRRAAARRRPGERLVRLRRAQPPGLAARRLRRRAAITCRGCWPTPAALGSFEEGSFLGADWLQTLGAVPNEYLYYYYNSHDAVRAARAASLDPAGAFLLPSSATSSPSATPARRWPRGGVRAPNGRPPTWPTRGRSPAPGTGTPTT